MRRRVFKVQSIHTILACSILLIFCGEQQPAKIDEATMESMEAKLDEDDSRRAILVESIIKSSPSLAETGEVFAEIGIVFNRKYLSDINNVDKYSTLKSQGINLGIYLADLGYITTFEQSQEVIFYMNCAQKLAEGIGVSDVFDEKMVERMEMNINQKDSIILLISELYWKTDAFLKELNRENISALIICGGWIEGMHIGSSLLEDGVEDDKLYRKLYQQKSNLKKILTLLKTFDNEPNIEVFSEKLTELEADFDTIPEIKNDVGLTIEQKDSLKLIAQKIEAFRNEINQP